MKLGPAAAGGPVQTGGPGHRGGHSSYVAFGHDDAATVVKYLPGGSTVEGHHGRATGEHFGEDQSEGLVPGRGKQPYGSPAGLAAYLPVIEVADVLYLLIKAGGNLAIEVSLVIDTTGQAKFVTRLLSSLDSVLRALLGAEAAVPEGGTGGYPHGRHASGRPGCRCGSPYSG